MDAVVPRPPLRRAAAVLLAAVMLMIPACTTLPVPGGPSSPSAPSPSERSIDLESLSQLCGVEDYAPGGQPAFAAHASPLAPAAGGMSIAVDLEVDLASGHGRHTADPSLLHGAVLDGAGTAVGFVREVRVDGVEVVPGEGASAHVEADLGACAIHGTELGGPLPDGDYRLLLSGYVRPEDHNHGQAEIWVVEPLPLVVAEGSAQLSSS
ncbi:hypothetical protein [Brachybacterium hainanense]|uniref:Lipoprotein n=1 Tax=Brachybacterium hainanense TaxID=1541174 RepID=A0ABV6R9A2_9MICO